MKTTNDEDRLTVNVLGIWAMLRAWVTRRLSVPIGGGVLRLRFDGWVPFRAFWSHGQAWYFSPWAWPSWRRHREWGLTTGEAHAEAAQDDDRLNLWLHEVGYHGVAGERGHEEQGVGAATMNRNKSVTPEEQEHWRRTIEARYNVVIVRWR